MESTKIGSLTNLTAETGYVHKLGTNIYVKTIHTLPGESEELYVEVSEKPPYTKTEYDAKVADLIRERYPEDEENALKSKVLEAILRPDTAVILENGTPKAVSQFDDFLTYRAECLERAKDAELYRREEMPE